MSKRLCKICKIKPHLNFHWLIGPSSIYVAKQQRTKWNHKKKNVLTFQWLCLILYLYKQFLRLGQNLPLSYPLLYTLFFPHAIVSINESLLSTRIYNCWTVIVPSLPSGPSICSKGMFISMRTYLTYYFRLGQIFLWKKTLLITQH